MIVSAAVAPEIAQPVNVTTVASQASVNDKVNAFLDELNNLETSWANGVNNRFPTDNVSILQMQSVISDYIVDVNLASKVAGAMTKSINTLVNSG